MNILIRWSTLVTTVLLAGCATSHPKEEPVHEQGWIGGRYQLAKNGFTASDWVFGVDALNYFPPALEHTWKAGILTDALGTNTSPGSLTSSVSSAPPRPAPRCQSGRSGMARPWTST